ncbi:MAG: bifunctional oligoribonuclease/PAP phosphatase NrnA [Bacteroidota bacterium]
MVKFNTDSVSGILSAIKGKKNVVIVMHANPDGDAVGSALGLSLILKKMGHRLTVISPDHIPSFLQWLPACQDVLLYTKDKTKCRELIGNADILFGVDFNMPDRIGKVEKSFLNSRALKILIDHHPHPGDFVDILISKPALSSTAELLWYLFRKLGLLKLMDKDIAEALFTGMLTDTGSFSFSCNDPGTFRIAANLLGFGIEKDKIHDKVYNNFSFCRMRLMGYCMNNKLEVMHDYHTALISITAEELKQFEYQPGDTEGFVNLPLSIAGIRFSALFIERKEHIKISFRSKGDFEVNKFATAHFSGGGHKNAAGGQQYNLPLDETLNKFRDLLKQYRELRHD